MKCKDCVYGYYSDEQGIIICMADENFLAPCEYEDEIDEPCGEDLYI